MKKIYYPGTCEEIQEYKYSEIFKSNFVTIKDDIFEMDNEPIKVGDYYLAERLTGIKVYQAKEIDLKNNIIIPFGMGVYCYYIQECRRIKTLPNNPESRIINFYN